MVSLKLFRSRNFAGANLLTLFLYASLGGLMFFFPMDLIQIQHYTATQAGAAFLPFVVIMFGLSRWAGGLVAAMDRGFRSQLDPSLQLAASHFSRLLRRMETTGPHSSRQNFRAALISLISVEYSPSLPWP
jgi:hypothetical protein